MIRILILALLSTVATAQDIRVQWATARPLGFYKVDDWSKLPKKEDPTDKALAVDDTPGWVTAVEVNGSVIFGCDHYSVSVSGTAVTTYCWRTWSRYIDAPSAQVCTFSGNKPSCVYYGHPWRDQPNPRPWLQFVAPAESVTLHGKMLPDDLWFQHKAKWEGYAPIYW